MEKFGIFGFSDYATLTKELATQAFDSEFKGYFVDDEFLYNHEPDSEVLGLSQVDQKLPKASHGIFCAIGYKQMRKRQYCFDRINKLDRQLFNIVSSHAYVDKSVTMGLNNIFMPGCVIERGVELGDNNIFWSNTTICHDTQIGSHNFFAAGVTIGGGCRVGNLCFFGFNSAVTQHLTIENECLLAAGSVLLENVASMERRIGTPARLYSKHGDSGIII